MSNRMALVADDLEDTILGIRRALQAVQARKASDLNRGPTAKPWAREHDAGNSRNEPVHPQPSRAVDRDQEKLRRDIERLRFEKQQLEHDIVQTEQRNGFQSRTARTTPRSASPYSDGYREYPSEFRDYILLEAPSVLKLPQGAVLRNSQAVLSPRSAIADSVRAAVEASGGPLTASDDDSVSHAVNGLQEMPEAGIVRADRRPQHTAPPWANALPNTLYAQQTEPLKHTTKLQHHQQHRADHADVESGALASSRPQMLDEHQVAPQHIEHTKLMQHQQQHHQQFMQQPPHRLPKGKRLKREQRRRSRDPHDMSEDTTVGASMMPYREHHDGIKKISPPRVAHSDYIGAMVAHGQTNAGAWDHSLRVSPKKPKAPVLLQRPVTRRLESEEDEHTRTPPHVAGMSTHTDARKTDPSPKLWQLVPSSPDENAQSENTENEDFHGYSDYVTNVRPPSPERDLPGPCTCSDVFVPAMPYDRALDMRYSVLKEDPYADLVRTEDTDDDLVGEGDRLAMEVQRRMELAAAQKRENLFPPSHVANDAASSEMRGSFRRSSLGQEILPPVLECAEEDEVTGDEELRREAAFLLVDPKNVLIDQYADLSLGTSPNAAVSISAYASPSPSRARQESRSPVSPHVVESVLDVHPRLYAKMSKKSRDDTLKHSPSRANSQRTGSPPPKGETLGSSPQDKQTGSSPLMPLLPSPLFKAPEHSTFFADEISMMQQFHGPREAMLNSEGMQSADYNGRDELPFGLHADPERPVLGQPPSQPMTDVARNLKSGRHPKSANQLVVESDSDDDSTTHEEYLNSSHKAPPPIKHPYTSPAPHTLQMADVDEASFPNPAPPAMMIDEEIGDDKLLKMLSQTNDPRPAQQHSSNSSFPDVLQIHEVLGSLFGGFGTSSKQATDVVGHEHKSVLPPPATRAGRKATSMPSETSDQPQIIRMKYTPASRTSSTSSRGGVVGNEGASGKMERSDEEGHAGDKWTDERRDKDTTYEDLLPTSISVNF